MQLGVVIGSLQRGGTETQLAQLLPELQSHGMNISVFVIGSRGAIAEELQAQGISIHGVDLPEFFSKLPQKLRRLLRAILIVPFLSLFLWRHKNAIVHLYLPEAVLLGGLLGVWWHTRMIASQRGLITYRYKYPNFIASLERFVFRRAAKVLVNSEAVKQNLREDGITRDIELIYNCLSPARLDPPNAERDQVRAELRLSKTQMVFVILANLHPYKGHADALRALAKLKQTSALPLNWHLLIIGRDVAIEGAEQMPNQATSWRAKLEQLCDDLGLAEHVDFLGERDDAPRLLRAADIGILPSHEEGFSNALLEMMGASLGIVATDVGGNGEALAQGEAGLLVPPLSPADIAKALQRLLDRDVRVGFGTNARKRVAEQFTLQACVDHHLALYQSMQDQGNAEHKESA